MKKECKGCDFVGEKTSAYIIFSSGHTESSINVPLWTPLWAASRLFWNDTTWFVAPPPGTKHLAVVRKNSYFHAPILWTKQRHQTWMHKTLRLSLAWYGRCLVIALPTHVTNKWAYQETHDIFFIIVIHSAHRRHQPSLNMCQLLYEHTTKTCTVKQLYQEFLLRRVTRHALLECHLPSCDRLKTYTNLTFILPWYRI